MTQKEVIEAQLAEARKRQAMPGNDPNKTTRVEVGTVKFNNLFSS